MSWSAEDAGLTVGIVGSGVMGAGIAQIAAAAGLEVKLLDAREGAADKAVDQIRARYARQVEKSRMSEAAADAAGLRLQVAGSVSELADAQLVVEAIVEDLEAKQALLRELESVVSPECILATNTSSLSVTAIASALEQPARLAGFHFFNPVPLMKVVEVIDGVLTSPDCCERLVALARRMGHTPVRASDTPGFLVNHAGRGLGTEGLRVLEEGIADVATIDRIMREGAGFRMGPFELFDLTGLDVSHPVMESIYNQFYQDPRYRPSHETRRRLAAGLLGRKSGRGFYDYADGEQQVPEEPPAPDTLPSRVWVSHAEQEDAVRVAEVLHHCGVAVDEAEQPGEDALCVLTPVGQDVSSAALAQGLDARRCVGIDTLFGIERRRTLMYSPVTHPGFVRQAHGLFASDGVPVSVVRDSPGFVMQRVVAVIVNIACEIAQRRIGTPEDIDRAVTLGLGYPQGPLAMGDAIGPARVLQILRGLETYYGDPRYRPSAWLTRRAQLGVSLLTMD